MARARADQSLPAGAGAGDTVQPDVTVVIPAFNPGPFLTDALRSIAVQTYPHWHVLLVDDGSEENVRDYVPPDFPADRLTILRLGRNQGQSVALNTALALVATPYFLQLDPDDWLLPEALAVLRQALAASPPETALMSANMRMVFQDGSQEATIWRGRPFTDRYDFLRCNLAVWPRFYRTEALRSVFGWPLDGPHGGRYLEDRRILCRLIEQYTFGWVDQVLLCYRRHSRNLTNQIAEHNETIRWMVGDSLKRWGGLYEPVFDIDSMGWLFVKDLVPVVSESAQADSPQADSHRRRQRRAKSGKRLRGAGYLRRASRKGLHGWQGRRSGKRAWSGRGARSWARGKHRLRPKHK